MAKDNIPTLIDRLARQRKLTQEVWNDYKSAKELEDITRDMLYLELKRTGLTSAKSKSGVSAVIAERTNIKIQHEQSVIEWLKNEPNVEADLYIGLKKTAFDGLAKTALKKNGEVIPGTEIETTEYISIRNPQKRV